MNMLAAKTISTRRQAYSGVANDSGVFRKAAYILVVTDLETTSDEEKPLRLEIFYVDYPDRAPGKGWGEPCMAEKPHFSQEFTLDELLAFFAEREFSVNQHWTALEADNPLFAQRDNGERHAAKSA